MCGGPINYKYDVDGNFEFNNEETGRILDDIWKIWDDIWQIWDDIWLVWDSYQRWRIHHYLVKVGLIKPGLRKPKN